jgi:hypothetical protein
MIKTIRATFKKLLGDNRGEDLTEVSSGLSKGAKAVIACAVITATAGGATTLANGANSASDTAAKKVTAPVGGQVGTTTDLQSPFKN